LNPKSGSGAIRAYIVDNVRDHPREIARLASEQFGITRQAVNRHLQALRGQGILTAEGQTKSRSYKLAARSVAQLLEIPETKEEDRVWDQFVVPLASSLPANVRSICQYGFTEILNNAIEHSEGQKVFIRASIDAKRVELIINDDGIGIFEKIKARFGLEDHRHAILELSKGKLTTDPAHHSGEGIFFASRMFDSFVIRTRGLMLAHHERLGDWQVEVAAVEGPGTWVMMQIATDSLRTTKGVFDQFADPEAHDYSFSRTHVPIRLAAFGEDLLVSRSQARRVLQRFDRFREVILDFSGVDSVGQAFADEIFRVFSQQNPGITIHWANANHQISQMIQRAHSARNELSSPASTPAQSN
jgi:anti-sigma regulatory factor (Ser/Thr protein kinase)/DNA-binding transcriptional ArsR family regulator